MNMSLIIIGVNDGAIDAVDSTCYGYYSIRFSLSLYTLQSDFNIDGQVISPGEMVCEVSYYFLNNNSSRYYVYPKNKSNDTIESMREIINVRANVICYYYNDGIPSYLK